MIPYVFLDGYSFSGILKDALDEVVRDILRVNWYVLDGRLHVEDPSLPSTTIPQVINAATGLIGRIDDVSEEDEKTKETIKKYQFRTFITPRVFVGQNVTLSSTVDAISAAVKVESIRKQGSNWTNDFYNDCIGRVVL